jgi:hypothetical protein
MADPSKSETYLMRFDPDEQVFLLSGGSMSLKTAVWSVMDSDRAGRLFAPSIHRERGKPNEIYFDTIERLALDPRFKRDKSTG